MKSFFGGMIVCFLYSLSLVSYKLKLIKDLTFKNHHGSFLPIRQTFKIDVKVKEKKKIADFAVL